MQELVSAKDQPALRTEKCMFGGDVVPPAALAAAYEQSMAYRRCLLLLVATLRTDGSSAELDIRSRSACHGLCGVAVSAVEHAQAGSAESKKLCVCLWVHFCNSGTQFWLHPL